MDDINKAVFLDRDGVLNRSTVRDGQLRPPASVDQLEILPGVAEALALLKRAGYLLIVVTNQPDVARGRARREDVEAIHEQLLVTLPLDAIDVCFHDDADDCACRKPRPGMLLNAAAHRHIDLRLSYIVGDRWRDVEAGRRANCRTILVDSGFREQVLMSPDHAVSSLLEATDWILSR